MIEVNGVTKKYGDFTAIEEINLNIGEGSIFGLVGYNGAGKTTLLKTICGILNPEEGSVTLDGHSISDNPQEKARMFLVSDDPYILPQASMKRMARFYKGYYPSWNDSVFERLTGYFKLDINKRMSGFSKGMHRQAFIIFALSTSPEYLFLDEAFDGIDPMMRDLCRQLLLEAIAEKGTSVMISSHNLRELEDLCDRVGVINGKRIVYDANVDDMRINKNKYKIAFSGETDINALFKELGIKGGSVRRDGKIITFVADGPADEITRKFASKSPLLLETVPLTLEEIFLIEMEAQVYDFKDLFK